MGDISTPLRPASSDPIGDAIAATADHPGGPTVNIASIQGAFNDTGRPFSLAVPADLSDAELGALVELLVRIKSQGTQRGPRLVRAAALPTRAT